MPKSSLRRNLFTKILKFLMVLFCLGGFLYQTLQFMFLYWTYPTVVDIQEISPSTLEMPAFSICNAVGYDLRTLCRIFKEVCMNTLMNRMLSRYLCKLYPVCKDNKLPKDYLNIRYARMSESYRIEPEEYAQIGRPLKDYFTCTIEFGGVTKSCDMENVRGSFFTNHELPMFCYSIYSLWGKPQGKRAVIRKGAVMKFHLYLNASGREQFTKNDIPPPVANVPVQPAMWIAVHSPYFLPSPIMEGVELLGGGKYNLRVTMKQSHLLPPPYQTNCTDYMKMWRERGGKAPINQLGVVEECRKNKTYDKMKCVPLSVDYPHDYTICPTCDMDTECQYNVSTDDCTSLADNFNQPCDSISYEISQEKTKSYFFEVEEEDEYSNDTESKMTTREVQLDCVDTHFFSIQCSMVDIEVIFDRFTATKVAYNAKFESLELFSVIGGYMGMWLGISLLSVYDELGSVLILIMAWFRGRRLKQDAKRRMAFKKRPKKNLQNNYYEWQI